MSQLVLENKVPSRKKSFKHGSFTTAEYKVLDFMSVSTHEIVWEELYDTSKVITKRHLVGYEETPFRIKLHAQFFSINHKLRGIYEEVLSSHRYLEYKDDWDDDDAIGCNPQVYLWTVELLIKYAEYVLKFYDIVVKSPEISIARDGSFDIEWRCDNRMLLMNVVNSEKLDVHFYGKDVNSTILKGFLHDLEINKEVSHWMQKLV
ncbi:hypothetical protein [Flavobacterium sp. ACAM 123]|jgi:hypothetical protein|uniref:hypothetical protein n=1 Tax=Flavobacterium sp. ACAM 123 TaxID=1189620 RepID=UPI0002F3FEDC|nr:hypothetical protein [Flavobacterium sp. ACAM 123]